MGMIALVLLTIPIALGLGLPLTRLCGRAAAAWGQLDAPGERKLHRRPIPVTGGIAIFWAMVLPALLGWSGVWFAGDWLAARLPEAVAVHLPGLRAQTPLAGGLLAGMALLHAVGLYDDRRAMGPYVKLAAQLLAAGVLVVALDVRLLEALGAPASIVLTLLWFIVVTNALNFLDNMDGLSAGVGVICAGILLTAALLGGQWFIAGLLGLLIGALLGFLAFNFPPASIFMGDGGSLVLGYVLAFAAARLTYVDLPPGEVADAAWWAVFTPVVVLAIPLYDLTSVTMIRIAQGRNPLRGDTQHFSHRLVRRGLSRRAAVVVIYGCTLATGLGGILLGRVAGWQAALIVAQTLTILLVLALLERTPFKFDTMPDDKR